MSFNYWIEKNDHAKQIEEEVPNKRHKPRDTFVMEAKGRLIHVRS